MIRESNKAAEAGSRPTEVEVGGLDGFPVILTSVDLAKLASLLAEPVLRPGDSGWGSAVLLWNGLVTKEPALVVQPTSAREVSAVVMFAAEHRLQISTKGGGHNIAGTAIADRGLMLDMSRMNSVEVDPAARLAQVGPGCLLQDVDRATQEHGLATVLGFISEVGVAGLTLGGGLGYLTRRFGWTVDNLEDVEIVTSDGLVRTASRKENPDLFWGVRGAGANLGVVTRFALRLHQVGPTVYGGLIAWPFERTDEILGTYRTITSRAPRELAVWLILMTAPAEPFIPVRWQGKKLCAMAVCYSGELQNVPEVMASIREIGDPAVDLLAEQPYTQVQSYLDDSEPKGLHYYWKTEYADGLSDGLLSTIRELFDGCPIEGAELGILHLAGALNEHPEDDGAVGNRNARYVIGSNGMWDPGDPAANTYRTWIRESWERQRPFTAGRSYINFQTADEGQQQVRAAYGTNYERLVQVKTKYDPDNLFRTNRNIAPSVPASESRGG
ncbi:FAD-binding oxidoreductase [Arthrobacter sp. Soil762]|uniref:FAD-binding oxidoreductase n=1 Tax=Arthrobacter sp. Soil762 TaxID=1736401 RepID=UPI0007011DE6|nr:FAD-binding oxidoreductase [Arthrobacter sp. Soil762]KRE80701.1 FAD-linked oxidase [Arthrobacter sp. Soil762]